jgi:hypothetical protein
LRRDFSVQLWKTKAVKTVEGHSLSMLRRVAKVLHARVRVVLEPETTAQIDALAEDSVRYRLKRTASKLKK